MNITTKEYWEAQYNDGKTGWNIGYPSPPITNYINQLQNPALKILIPGSGNAFEAEYLFNKGFKNVFILDIALNPLVQFQKRNPLFPDNQIIHDDFFKHNGKYDLIIEQTFFSALPKNKRQQYVEKMFNLLNDNGKLVGVLFQIDFNNSFPPFGGSIEEYQELFSDKFNIITLETAYNSIKPRTGNEVFFIFSKKNLHTKF